MLTLPWVPPKRRNGVSTFSGTVKLLTSRAGDALTFRLTGSRLPVPPTRSHAHAHTCFLPTESEAATCLCASREPLCAGPALSLGRRLVNCTRIDSRLRSKAKPVHTPCVSPDTRPASLSVASCWKASRSLPTESLASATPGWGPRGPAALLRLRPRPRPRPRLRLEPPVHGLRGGQGCPAILSAQCHWRSTKVTLPIFLEKELQRFHFLGF